MLKSLCDKGLRWTVYSLQLQAYSYSRVQVDIPRSKPVLKSLWLHPDRGRPLTHADISCTSCACCWHPSRMPCDTPGRYAHKQNMKHEGLSNVAKVRHRQAVCAPPLQWTVRMSPTCVYHISLATCATHKCALYHHHTWHVCMHAMFVATCSVISRLKVQHCTLRCLLATPTAPASHTNAVIYHQQIPAHCIPLHVMHASTHSPSSWACILQLVTLSQTNHYRSMHTYYS